MEVWWEDVAYGRDQWQT